MGLNVNIKVNKENFDYINLMNYKEHNDTKAFDNLYKKYKNYISTYSWQIYQKIKRNEKCIEKDDILQHLIEKCFIPCIKGINLKIIKENFSLNPFLSRYLKLYSRLYVVRCNKIKKISIDSDIVLETLNENSFYVDDQPILKKHYRDVYLKKLSYDPTDTYVPHIEHIKERIRKNLDKKEIQFFNYMVSDYKLIEIESNMGFKKGCISKYKKKLQNKIKNIIIKENLL